MTTYTRHMRAAIETAPAGTGGLLIEPWSAGEVYGVAANWAEPSAPVFFYGDSGWQSRQYQVADFRHSDTAALRLDLADAIQAGGDDPDEADDIVGDAVDFFASDASKLDMIDMLEGHGDRFTGKNVDDEAQGWLDEGFDADSADDWCEIGVWDSATAAQLRDAGLSPEQVREACERLIEDASDDARDEYTDGDPIYSVCNNDTSIDVLIDAAKIDA